MNRILFFVLAALLLSASVASGHSNCIDGQVFDDDTFENAYGAGSASRAHFVMRLDPVGVSRLSSVCLCFLTTDSPAPQDPAPFGG